MSFEFQGGKFAAISFISTEFTESRQARRNTDSHVDIQGGFQGFSHNGDHCSGHVGMGNSSHLRRY